MKSCPGLGGLTGRGARARVLAVSACPLSEAIMHNLSVCVKCVGIATAVTFLAGCTGWSTEMKVEETAYQALSLYDTAQTVQTARHPECYSESDPLTSAILGSHPRPNAVIGYGIARAGLHAFVTDWMQKDGASPTALRIWQGLTIVYEANDVRKNAVIGLRFGSAHVPSYAPCLHR